MVETRKTTKAAAEKTTSAAPVVQFPTLEMPKFEIPKLDLSQFPQIEVPPMFREFAEKGTAQLKAGYEKMKASAEEATDVIEDTFETARAGANELNQKSLSALKANTDAVFAFASSLLGAKTVAEVVELQTAFARSQFEAITSQAKEFQAVAQKVAEETAAPVKSAVSKTMKDLKVA